MTTDQKISVQRTINASSREVFDLLSNPARHPEFDGSGFVRSHERSDRVTASGQVFRMNMAGDHMGGEYQTDNVVTGFDPKHLIAWQTAPADTEPPGWEWTWELESQGTDSTDVRLTYDWSKVTDQSVLQKVSFPLVSKDQLEESLSKLASALSG